MSRNLSDTLVNISHQSILSDRWRPALFGALLTLSVTVIGGLILYYFAQWNEKQGGERLVYNVENASAYTRDSNSLSIQTLYLANEGNVTSEGIRMVIRFDESTNIDNSSIEFLSGVPSEHSSSLKNAWEIEYGIQNLTPGETVRLSFLVSGAPPYKPIVSAKSQGMIGRQVDYIPGSGKPQSAVTEIVPYLIAIAGLVQIPAIFFLRKRLKGSRDSAFYDASPNNTAFLLIHQGLHEDAESLLLDVIRRRGGDRYIFGNLGLCRALRGEYQNAALFFNAAEFIGGDKHSMAVLNFNKGLDSYLEEDLESGDAYLARALQDSAQEIGKYLAYSSIVHQLRSGSSEIQGRIESTTRAAA